MDTLSSSDAIHLSLNDGNDELIRLPVYLLKYFVTLRTMLEDMGMSLYPSKIVIPLYGDVRRDMLLWVIAFYEKYDHEKFKWNNHLELSKKPFIVPSQWSELKDETLGDLLSIARFLNYMDSQLLLDIIIKRIVNLLLLTPETKTLVGDDVTPLVDMIKESLPLDLTALIQFQLSRLARFRKVEKRIATCDRRTLFATDHGLYACGDLWIHHVHKPLEIDHHMHPISVVCGRKHCIITTKDGDLYGLGSTGYGQLGHIDDEPFTWPYEMDVLPPNLSIYMVSCGAYHTMFLTSDGLYVCGQNDAGQLGLGHYDENDGITKVTFSETIAWVGCGDYHTIVLTASNKLYGFGTNANGQLGLPPKHWMRMRVRDFYPSPVLIPLPTEEAILLVTCGSDHTIVLTERALYACYSFNTIDDEDHAPLYPLTLPPELTPQSIKMIECGSDGITILLTHDGLVYGLNTPSAKQETGSFSKLDEGVTSVSCGDSSIFLVTDNTVRAMGGNKRSQLGINDNNKESVIREPMRVDIEMNTERETKRKREDVEDVRENKKKRLAGCATCSNSNLAILQRENNPRCPTRLLFCHRSCQAKFYNFTLNKVSFPV